MCHQGQDERLGSKHYLWKSELSWTSFSFVFLFHFSSLQVPVLGHGTLALMENEYQVEGEVQGPEPSVQEFLKQIDKGPRHAHVVKLEKRELDVKEGDDQFVVLRTGESIFQSGA